MESPDRREFLGSITVTAGAFALPAWLAKWFSPQDPVAQDPAKEREKQLRAAVQKAKDHGKPLLVFVVPGEVNGGEMWMRGEWFGALLNHGGSLALLEVALCVPACTTLAEVQKVTGAKAIDGKALLCVVDVAQVGVADAPPPRATSLVLDLGSPLGEGLSRGFDEKALAEQQKRIEDGVAKLTAELHATIHRHGGSMAKLMADVRAKMTDDQRAAIAAWAAGGRTPSDELLVRAAAEVRSLASDGKGEVRERQLKALHDAAQREFVKKRIAGSRWAQTRGCGTSIEPAEGDAQVTPGVACGMGQVPAMCERFLDFYVNG